jgi:hypothetical protein
MGPAELVDACGRAAHDASDGAIVRVFLEEVDPAAFRQVAPEEFQEAVPAALHVQVEPGYGAVALAVQGIPEIGRLELEWDSYVERQDLSGVGRGRVREAGRRFLAEAEAEAS